MVNPDNFFKVETDASDFAFKGQLVQRDEEGRLYFILSFRRSYID